MTGTPQHDPYAQDPYGRNPYGQAPDAAAQAPYGQAPDAAAQAPYGRPPASGSQQWPDGGAPQWSGQPAWNGQQQGWSAPMAAPRRPGSIMAAFWLILSAGLVLLLTTVLAALALNTDQGRSQVQDALDDAAAQSGLPADQVEQLQGSLDTMMPAIMGVTVALGILAFLVYLLIASKIRGGSRAARTVGTVLAVISVLMIVVNVAAGGFSPLDLLWVLLGVLGLVFAYRRESTEFMRLKAWERASRR